MPDPAGILSRSATMTDEEVVSRVLAGDTPLFEVLMRRHNGRVYRAARAILRDGQEAEDVMQEAYVNAYAHLAQFDRRAKFSTWLTKIAVYEALLRVKRLARYEPLDDHAEDTLMPTTPPPDPEQQAFGAELRTLIEAAIDALGDGYREVFMLREVEGLSTEETADILGVSADVVRTRLTRARRTMQQDLRNRTGTAMSEAFMFGQAHCDAVVAAVLTRIVSR
jgi:RNA polymerase sigma-70 factor (ECF subfamily)